MNHIQIPPSLIKPRGGNSQKGEREVGPGYYKDKFHWRKMGMWRVVACHWLRRDRLSLAKLLADKEKIFLLLVRQYHFLHEIWGSLFLLGSILTISDRYVRTSSSLELPLLIFTICSPYKTLPPQIRRDMNCFKYVI